MDEQFWLSRFWLPHVMTYYDKCYQLIEVMFWATNYKVQARKQTCRTGRGAVSLLFCSLCSKHFLHFVFLFFSFFFGLSHFQSRLVPFTAVLVEVSSCDCLQNVHNVSLHVGAAFSPKGSLELCRRERVFVEPLVFSGSRAASWYCCHTREESYRLFRALSKKVN